MLGARYFRTTAPVGGGASSGAVQIDVQDDAIKDILMHSVTGLIVTERGIRYDPAHIREHLPEQECLSDLVFDD